MSTTATSPSLPGARAIDLLEELSTWANTATIIVHAGCVFEFKGVFPKGAIAQGYYNLDSGGKGFEGHIKLQVIARVVLQSKLHRGRQSYAFVFENHSNEVIFKVFLGRDSNGELHPAQVAKFQRMQAIEAVYGPSQIGETHEK